MAGKAGPLAELTGETAPFGWRFWECPWQVPAEHGNVVLMARATDAAGRTQPPGRVAEYGTYMVNHWLPMRVEVRPRAD